VCVREREREREKERERKRERERERERERKRERERERERGEREREERERESCIGGLLHLDTTIAGHARTSTRIRTLSHSHTHERRTLDCSLTVGDTYLEHGDIVHVLSLSLSHSLSLSLSDINGDPCECLIMFLACVRLVLARGNAYSPPPAPPKSPHSSGECVNEDAPCGEGDGAK
jgi:hypothetical protein